MTETQTPLDPRPIGATPEQVAQRAGALAPYLSRLLRRDGDDLPRDSFAALSHVCAQDIAAIRALDAAALSPDALKPRLRQAKRRVHLALALLDLGGAMPVGEITTSLTQLADASLQAALSCALGAHQVSGEGIFLISFGKMGAFELNYSSDIDLAAFFDPDVFEGGRRGPQDTAVRVVRDVCSIMEAQTEDGYVFRTDLRLRPDPSSTPVAVSTRRAEVYYQSVGQNWERMAWIKARPCAGDMQAAGAFTKMMAPFVWRRHLDYWALADIHAIKRMINAKVGDPEIGAVDCDVKLGPGGIREIEFYAQTQQVILGGRDPSLRIPGTEGALAALAEREVIATETADALTSAYRALRGLEHRIQMLSDEQTHTLPADGEARARVAGLMGFDDVAELDSALFEVRNRVHGEYADLFAAEAAVAAPTTGNLVFTGVDDDPGTLTTLSEMGFASPSRVIASFRRWHFGNVPATRTARGQALLTALTPRLLEAMATTGEPNVAFAHFERFFEGLKSGVQLMSMLNSEGDLLEDLVATLAIAPRLASILSRRPNLLEALVTPQSKGPFAAPHDATFEQVMNDARRFHRDRTFLLGHALLNGRLEARKAGGAWSQLAREMVAAMARAAETETIRRFGAMPGRWAVMGMGSLGAGELTAGSDLDMIVIYTPAEGADANAQSWFTRFTQRLITALSAPTAEGALYEVDMRLRPSGRAGPVAVKLTSFQKYQNDDAWTWEHMALTRMAFLCGDADLGEAVTRAACGAITARRARPQIASDVDEMRARMRKERPGQGVWDLKLSPGGLVDIEFGVQKQLLLMGAPGALTPSTRAAIKALCDAGRFPPETAGSLTAAWDYFTSLRQVLKLSLTELQSDQDFSAGIRDRLCRAVGAADFEDLLSELNTHKAHVMAAFPEFSAAPGDGRSPDPR